ncbi:hypothetical protein V6Z12_A10G200800 [Gossypium hirsutum]
MPQLRMVSKHCCKESILIPVALPSNSKPLDPTLTKNLYCQKLHQTGYAFSRVFVRELVGSWRSIASTKCSKIDYTAY